MAKVKILVIIPFGTESIDITYKSQIIQKYCLGL